MNVPKALTVAAAVALGFAGPVLGAGMGGFSLQVLLDGSVRPEYRARGAVYVEAVRDRPYVLRITNPLPVRVAVALSVDGLNSIDASHTDSRTASKWVLGPYESVEIPGWQVSGSDARRFFFTGERSSYGAWLGQSDNLGVIEAVFYREKVWAIPVVPRTVQPRPQEPMRDDSSGTPSGRNAPGPAAEGLGAAAGCLQKDRKVSDEYAATGIGERTRHEVQRVDLELEGRPAAVVRVRYEFREQLVRLGVLPAAPDPLARREGARGFLGDYCPQPSGGR